MKDFLSPVRATFPHRISRITSLIPTVLLPSFLHPRSNDGSSSNKVSPTAWLDGMRGLAAFFLYIRHFGAIHHPQIQPGFGSSDANRYIIQLPFIRLLVSGPSMVALFFIISGYALSWGPIKTIHAGQVDKSLERLSSATFRRAMRIYLPGMISTFFIMIFISLGLYDRGHRAWQSDVDVPGFKEPQPPQWRNDPFSVQFWDWVRCTWQWINIWSGGGHPYNPHLWTLGTEFRCSIALFMVLLALARTKAAYRCLGLFGMVVYCYYTNAWSEWLFFAGAFLAQVKMFQEDRIAALPVAKLEEDISDDGHPKSLSGGDLARMILFIIGLYLLSAPDYGHASNAPGYILLTALLTPTSWPESWRFLHCLGGAFIVYSVSTTRTHSLRFLFDNAYSRYLGKISYALYLVHGPIVHTLGFWLVPWFWQFTGRENQWAKEAGWGMAFVVQTMLVIWAADVFWRVIDNRCVAFAKWCEMMVTEKGS